MIDGRNLALQRGTGVATYARNLSYQLHELGHEVGVLYGHRRSAFVDSVLSEILFFDDQPAPRHRYIEALDRTRDLLGNPFGYFARTVPVRGVVELQPLKQRLPYFDYLLNSPNLFRDAHALYGILKVFRSVSSDLRPDVMHWTYPLPLRMKGVPNLYTMHDLVPLRLPYTTLDNKRHYLRLNRKIARKADLIVTISEHSKRDICDLLGVDEHRVFNTYQAVHIPDKYVNKPADIVQREVEGTFGLDYKNYYLFWGSIEPKKNIHRMIEAYLASRVEGPLVLLGASAWKSEDELRLLNDDHIRWLREDDKGDTRVKKRIVTLSYAPFSLLVSLIRGAKAALFPSLYEGFGLPVLEAMSLGTPVISANVSSIPEIAGDAAILVDPYDAQSLTNAIRAVDADSDLRSELVRRGRHQAMKFSELQYQTRLQELYGRVL
jgi:glycosyltransferase involved in cell wall biosynthesis